MANVQFQNATVFRRKTMGKVQTAESVRISVKNDIAEVYSVGVENVINSCDVSEGEVTFFGKTVIKFLYNDGASIAGSTYNADFTASIANGEISPESKVCFDVVTVDTKVDTNANTATLTILLEVTAYAYVSDNVVYFAESDDCFVKKEGVEVLVGANVANLAAVVDEELSATKNIGTVLLAESALCVCDYTNLDGVLKISGDAVVRLTYLSEGTVVTDSLPFKFERELDATDIPVDAQLKITPRVRSTKVRLDIAEDSVNTNFSVEIALSVCVEQCVVGVLETVADAYGANCDFAFARQNLTTTLPCGSTVARKKISATLPLESGKTVATAVNTGATVTKCTSLDKTAQVEGIVYATILYKTETGYESAPLEIPFVQNVDINYLAPQCESFANCALADLQIVDNGTLQVTAEICLAVDSMRDATYGMIVSAEEKPFDKKQLPAIEVCLAHKGETLWTLAKGLHMSEEDLLAVNPEISDPLEKDARIVVYNKV
ncbi:MAG: DUF3794 domain-containing protein [Candidatus Fimimonas sp.]